MWFDFAHQPGDGGDEGEATLSFFCPIPTCPERTRVRLAPEGMPHAPLKKKINFS
jgi:hypothetical protein